MMKKTRTAAIAALGLGVALAASACAGGGSARQRLLRQRPGHADLLDERHPRSRPYVLPERREDLQRAHPGVTVKMQNIQNESLRRQAADRAELWHRAGHLLPARRRQDAGHGQREPGPATDPHRRGPGQRQCGRARRREHQRQGLRRAGRHPAEGIYYSKDLFQQAGITSNPTTIPDLEADVAKLKAIGVAPIAVGAKDAWGAAHWYYNFALRECSQTTMNDVGHEPEVHRPVLDQGRRRPDGVPAPRRRIQYWFRDLFRSLATRNRQAFRSDPRRRSVSAERPVGAILCASISVRPPLRNPMTTSPTTCRRSTEQPRGQTCHSAQLSPPARKRAQAEWEIL